MKRHTIVLTLIVLAMTFSPASAALYDLSYYGYSEAIIYDSNTSLMWLSDADASGLMTQGEASGWAGGLTNEGGGWRLPNGDMSGSNDFDSLFAELTRVSSASTFDTFEYTTTYGVSTFTSSIDINTDAQYWSDTDMFGVFARTFDFRFTGDTNTQPVGLSNYAWAVRFDDTVDLTHAPVPASLWLMASGILGLLGYRRMGSR